MSRNRPLVSVVIPCYNSEEWLEDTLDSVYNQTYNHLEVIVIDDGSTDNTKEIVKKYSDKIKYIYQENSGPSVARNTGINNSKGEYIAFLDADDMWEEDKLIKQIEFMKNNSSYGVVVTDLKVVNESNEYLYTHKNIWPENKKEIIEKIFMGGIGMSTPTIMARKNLLEKVGGFDEQLPAREDHFLLMNVAEISSIKHIQEPLVRRRINDSSFTQNINPENLFHFNKPFIRKSIVRYKYLADNLDRVYSRLNFSIGRAYWKNNNRRKATIYLIRSLTKSPLSFKKYLNLVLILTGVKYRYYQKFNMYLKSYLT